MPRTLLMHRGVLEPPVGSREAYRREARLTARGAAEHAVAAGLIDGKRWRQLACTQAVGKELDRALEIAHPHCHVVACDRKRNILTAILHAHRPTVGRWPGWRQGSFGGRTGSGAVEIRLLS